MSDQKIFQDRFKIQRMDPDNKTPFRNVSRIHLTSQYKLNLQVDINTQIYPMALKQSFLIRVSNCDSVKNYYNSQQLAKNPEKDNFDYVAYGVVFDIVEKAGELTVFASFGGLIMRVNGKANALSGFRKDGNEARVYLMIKRA